MDKHLLEILCCPVTHQSLREARPSEIELANEKLLAPITQGLIRADGLVLYPVRNGIPLLVREEALSLL